MARARRRIRFTLFTTVLFATAAIAVAAPEAVTDDFVPPDDYPEGWYARIETSMGRIIAMLHPDQAPQSVAHFAALASGSLEWLDPVTGKAQKTPYYDGIEVSFAKAGNLFEVGRRPGTSDAPEIYVPLEGPRGFNRGGRLGMTTSGAGISGVVFFVTAASNRGLDGKYPCFGTVVSDQEILHRICGVKTHPNGRPIDPVTIVKIRIFSVGNPEPLPEPKPYTPQRRKLEYDPGPAKD